MKENTTGKQISLCSIFCIAGNKLKLCSPDKGGLFYAVGNAVVPQCSAISTRQRKFKFGILPIRMRVRFLETMIALQQIPEPIAADLKSHFES
jgi:hypothetical protein